MLAPKGLGLVVAPKPKPVAGLGAPKDVEPKAGLLVAPNAGALAPNAGADAPKAGAAPNAG